MPTRRHRFPVALAAAAMLAGCVTGVPLPSIPTTTTGDSSDNIAAATSSGGTAVAVGTESAFSASLAAKFPDCHEAPDTAALRERIMGLVNQARQREGLGLVRHNQVLEDEATQYACELIQYDFFDHVNPVTGTTLSDRADNFDYKYLAIGENLAAGQPTPQEAFDDWMNSEGHRANILNPHFTELGIGIRTGGSFGIYWVQEFGRPTSEPLNQTGPTRP